MLQVCLAKRAQVHMSAWTCSPHLWIGCNEFVNNVCVQYWRQSKEIRLINWKLKPCNCFICLWISINKMQKVVFLFIQPPGLPRKGEEFLDEFKFPPPSIWSTHSTEACRRFDQIYSNLSPSTQTCVHCWLQSENWMSMNHLFATTVDINKVVPCLGKGWIKKVNPMEFHDSYL